MTTTDDRSASEAASTHSRSRRPALTVGMATRDDYDGVYFTVTALSLYHPEVSDRIEILVADNGSDGRVSAALRELADKIPQMRYLPAGELRGPAAVKDRMIREARADWVLCIDCHVLLAPGALARLLAFSDANPDSRDLLQGPLADEDMTSVATHSDPVWAAGMFGRFSLVPDPRGLDPDAPPFEIGMHGMGLFACRKAVWLGFNPRFTGHGGEEGYIHAKFRAAGRRVLCLPFLRWTHRFDRPDRPAAAYSAWERFRNHMIGWEELGLPTEQVIAHYRHDQGPQQFEKTLKRWESERDNPFSYFDAIYCLNLDNRPDRLDRIRHRLRALGIEDRVLRLPAIATPGDPAVGCALSHRAVLAAAARDGMGNVLVLEDDAVFLTGTPWILRRSLRELSSRQWDLFYLGGFHHCAPRWMNPLVPLDGCAHLADAAGMTTTHAIAYNGPVFERLLAELPADEAGMRRWITEHRAIDIYFAERFSGRAVCCVPTVATQENLLIGEDPDMRDQFDFDPTSHVTGRAHVDQEPHLATDDARRTTRRARRANSGAAVIIPVRNGSDFIDQALGSLAAQTVPAEQIVVVDDCSDDDSYDRAMRWAAILPIEVIRLPRHVGVSQARQIAIAAVGTELIAQLDVDDMFLPNHIAVMTDAYRRSPGLIASHRLAMFDTEPNSSGRHQPVVEFCPDPPDQLMHLLIGNYVGIGCLYSMRDYHRVGGYRRIRYAEDWDLWLRFATAGIPITRTPDTTYAYRVHPNSVSSTVDFTEDDLEVLEYFLTDCTDTGLRQIAKLAILQRTGAKYLTRIPAVPRSELHITPSTLGLVDDQTFHAHNDTDLGTVVIGTSLEALQRTLVIVSAGTSQDTLRAPIAGSGQPALDLKQILHERYLSATH
ncbi:glycosyltransferase [Nocardia sp. NPDC057030]|uniref:glycosyltransferase n=1 Tax=unclassified Nocardia TaxID=2637762 RepID=UPI003627E35F